MPNKSTATLRKRRDALLRQLPGVAHVETAVAVARPSARIIHLRDWHSVPRDLSALDLRQAHGRESAFRVIERGLQVGGICNCE